MPYLPNRNDAFVSLYTLAAGALGAGLAYLLSVPVFPLIGPAILISIWSLTGARFAITELVRDAAFLFVGIGIGAGVNDQAAAALIRWPLAFVALSLTLLAALLISQWLLVRFFNMDHRSAVLSATPGHLSYIISLGTELNVDISRIAVVQSIRLLTLTLSVPFLAIAFGVEVPANVVPMGTSMSTAHETALLVMSVGLGFILKRFKVPAAFLIAAMLVSASGQMTHLTPGVLSPMIALPCLVILGTLIGSRFSGITITQLKASALAGLATTTVTTLLICGAALPVAYFLGMPIAHVVVAFAPGGLETMVTMGAVFGADPGFVAACHVGRLLLLTILVPAVLARKSRP